MTRPAALITLIAGICAGTFAGAEPKSYGFDMGHSRIFFDISHRGFSMMQGRFADFGGTFMFDAETPANSSLDITIDAASIDMFHDGLNNHLKTADFFDVEEHPELRFVSNRVETSGEDEFSVHGELTMLGQTHPVTFDVVLNQTGQGRGGAAMAGFSAAGTVDRTLYGMNYGSPMIGTDVRFRIEIEASERM